MSDMHEARGLGVVQVAVPLAFILCGGWLTWHMPAFTLDFIPPDDESAFNRLSAQFRANDVTAGLPGLFGGFADALDWIALIGLPVFLVIGVATVHRAQMEYEGWGRLDRFSAFLGRVTMLLILIMVSVMIYEVVLRYVFERPTLWANEMTLWIAGFVFLLAGLYAMQQRSHIRIFLLYDVMPRTLQRVFDLISTALILIFAGALIYGGWGESQAKFMRWETFGTAFDPPIPATLKPMVLFVVTMVALQAVANLIRDWNREPEIHSAADEIDAEELAALRRAAQREGVGDEDVTRGTFQTDPRKHH